MYIGVGGIYVPRYVGNSCTQVWGVFMYPGMGGFTYLGMGGGFMYYVLRYGGDSCTQLWRIHVPRYGGIHVFRYGDSGT